MRKVLFLLLVVFVCILVSGSTRARDCLKYVQCGSMIPADSDTINKFILVSYDFDPVSLQGWYFADNTAQKDTFWHVDNFDGLGGGSKGFLVPLEGTQSVWCGVRSGSEEYLSSWATAPGYGNLWDQRLTSEPIYFTGQLTLSFKGSFDSEAGYDFTYIEYDRGDENWVEFASYDGESQIAAEHHLFLSKWNTKLRFRFVSDCALSDEDGYYNSDGAVILDSIIVRDSGGIIDYEDFESAAVGDQNTGFWHADIGERFGKFSDLQSGLIDHDPFNDNFTTQVSFFKGSVYPSADYPGLFNTPFCMGRGGIEAPCHDEMVVSPIIDMKKYSWFQNENQDTNIPPAQLAGLTEALLVFTVYRDLPLENFVFYQWRVRNIDETGYPGPWLDGGMLYYSPYSDYFIHRECISDLVGGDKIQVALGIVDMCGSMYETAGDCANHTPAPYFDNVQVIRYRGPHGPKWRVNHAELFADNFSSNPNDIESYVRADMAADINAGAYPGIRPGDSIVVWCGSPLGGGIAEDVNGDPRVYMHVKAEYIGPSAPPWGPKPQYLYGMMLEGTYGSYESDDGAVWTVIQAECIKKCPPYCREGFPGDGPPPPANYCVDLNDSLFTRGYMIEYYFSAYDNAGGSSCFGVYPVTFSDALSSSDQPSRSEWTCLPTGNSDILYVDACHLLDTGTGSVESYFGPAFQAVLPPDNQPDVYDVMGSTSLMRGGYPVIFSGVSNVKPSITSTGLGSRGHLNHLLKYKKIIWDAGELKSVTIPTGRWTKRDDCQLLNDWMDTKAENAGLWILGDNVAEDISRTPAGAALLNRCGVVYTDGSYYDATGGLGSGGTVTPLVVGTGGSLFNSPPPDPDSFYVYGGTPMINYFDVLSPITGSGIAAMEYPDYPSGTKHYAAIQHDETNQFDKTIRTMWFGFSFKFIRNYRLMSPIAHFRVLEKVIDWFENATNPDITEAEDVVPIAYALAQNYPNPFNPVTTIMFEMREKGAVTIRIYDVAGRLVRTLVDGMREAGPNTVTWEGKNDAGSSVASGVYFYRMEAKDFIRTRKIVLLR